MSKKKKIKTHTPGPWVARHSGFGDAEVIADCGWKNHDGTPFKPAIVRRINWEDARLIAAAPDLLAYLKFLTEAAEMEPGMQIYKAHIEQAKALIEQATCTK